MSLKTLREKNIEETKEKLRNSVGNDDLIMQVINLIDEHKKVVNILVKRLREWYELYNPEFSYEISDNSVFVRLICEGKDKRPKDSMGANLSKEDVASIKSLSEQISSEYYFISYQEEYLKKLMQKNCPNITEVAGYLIGAKLIELAGGLRRLIMFPSSTVQILGAEKALFRHLKTKARMPKHGIIVQHPLIASSPKKEHGKRARALADKLLLAAKVDYFKGEFIGDKLRKQLEEKFK